MREEKHVSETATPTATYTIETTTAAPGGDAQAPQRTVVTTVTMPTGYNTQAPGATVIANVIPGQEANCRAALEAIGAQALNNPNHPLDKLGTVHFFRSLMINNDSQLMLSIIFDGSTLQYVKDFYDLFVRTEATPAFSYCEDFPENWREDQQAFIDFYVAHLVPTIMEYSYYPFATCTEVRGALKAQEGFATMLDQMQ
jgi:hypothetical protein